MDNRKENIIVDLTFSFALDIISFVELLDEKRKYVISKQLLKSGTSIGANVREAQNAESKADFIHKMKIALKETDETIYWLSLIKSSSDYPNCHLLLEKIVIIDKVLTKIVSTSKNKVIQN